MPLRPPVLRLYIDAEVLPIVRLRYVSIELRTDVVERVSIVGAIHIPVLEEGVVAIIPGLGL